MADPSTEPEVEPMPSADDISVVFHMDPPPPPAVVRRRPFVLTALWALVVFTGAAAVLFVVREAADTGPRAAQVIEVGEFRSLTDGGEPVEMRCDRRQPSLLGSPCLRELEFVDTVLGGRSSVLLVGNVASARHPEGALRCVLLTGGEDGAPSTARTVRCPDHDFVPAG